MQNVRPHVCIWYFCILNCKRSKKAKNINNFPLQCTWYFYLIFYVCCAIKLRSLGARSSASIFESHLRGEECRRAQFRLENRLVPTHLRQESLLGRVLNDVNASPKGGCDEGV